MNIRTVIFWLHLTAGVVAGVVVLIMCVTGILLTYEKQMVAWAERSPLAAPPSPNAPRLSIETLIAGVRQARPSATPSTLTFRADRAEPVSVAFGRDGQLLLNAYTGQVVGEGAVGLRAFFRSVTDWHRWLAATGEYRSMGKAVTGACNLTFLALVISGAYLWLPRAWTALQLRNITWFRRGLPGKARDFNWHNTIGFWSCAPLFIVVLSATVISYPRASNLVYRVVGEEPPATAPGRDSATAGRPAPQRAGGPGPGGSGGAASGSARPIRLGGLDAQLARAEQQVGAWRTISLRVPADDKAPLVFVIDQGSGGQPQKRGTLTLDRATGAVVKWEPFASNSPGRRLRTILRFAHTGEVLGLPGQTIAGIASAGGTALVYTGLALSLRRFLSWRRRRAVDARQASAA
jgi:uncharacterized iron-regulated membrane protein